MYETSLNVNGTHNIKNAVECGGIQEA